MGVFTRVRDIINANINAMLDRAEDPEKMVKLIIREMEDTLVEVKANCAGAMATQKKVQRELDTVRDYASKWENKAALAVEKGREDLAREALIEKRRFAQRCEALEEEYNQAKDLVAQAQSDITQLEDKAERCAGEATDLVQRHRNAQTKQRAQNGIRRFDTSDAFHRFEAFQQRIDRMEADAHLVNFGRKPDLEERFREIETDEDLERELNELKAKAGQQAEA